MQYVGTARWGTVQTVAYTGTAGTVTNGVTNGVNRVRISCTTDAFIAVGTAPTATTSGVPVFAGQPEYISIYPGEKVSAIQRSAGGDLSVVECP